MRLLPSFIVLSTALLACGNASDGSGTADTPPSEGELIFRNQCANCHGRSGDLAIGGAKDLRVSTLSRDEATAVVTHGRGMMMAYGEILNKTEIKAVVDHVFTLRQTK